MCLYFSTAGGVVIHPLPGRHKPDESILQPDTNMDPTKFRDSASCYLPPFPKQPVPRLLSYTVG